MIPAGVVFAYLALVLYIGIFASRGKASGSGAEDYFLAGRTLGPAVFLLSLFGTNMTAFSILGASGHAFANGIVTYGLMASSSALVIPLSLLLVGTRLWASSEALVHPAMHEAAIMATGDDTVRQSITDIARGYDWPGRFDIRTVRNAYIDQWTGREDALRSSAAVECPRYAAAAAGGDATVAAAVAGEVVGLIDLVEPARDIVAGMVHDAAHRLRSGAARVAAR